MLTANDKDFLFSLSDSELEAWLSTLPEQAAKSIVHELSQGLLKTNTGPINERDSDALRKRKKRSESARIVIPDCINPSRRERCLADPELFLKTYFPQRYRRQFGSHHKKMIQAILDVTQQGSRQAIAAPRGCGKTELVKGLLVFLILAGMVRFPLPVAATSKLASKIYNDFRKKIATNDLLLEDFPEVCWPVRELQGAPQRAARQHIDGALTNIVWTGNDLRFPDVPGSAYGGIKMSYYGLDTAFRGANTEGDRPDFILIDDPETRESAKSLLQISDRSEILDQDIDGLAGEGEQLAIVVLTTLQNAYCLSAQLTDRTIRPAYNGMRFGLIVKWPTRMDLWESYVQIRKKDQTGGDRYGRTAVKFYLDQFEEMNAGAELLTDSYKPKTHPDGTQLVYSTLQEAWNKIADTNMAAFKAEYQNDPEKEDEVQKITITATSVASKWSGIERGVAPDNCIATTLGVDIGKYDIHWVKTGYDNSGAGCVMDYGICQTQGLNTSSSGEAIERAIIASLERFADSDPMIINRPLLVLVDSGNWSDAIYEACRRLGSPFFPSKGWADSVFRMPTQSTPKKQPFIEAYAVEEEFQRVWQWRYNINTEYWKNSVHERFALDPWIEKTRVPGSLSLFIPESQDFRRHLQFGRHIVSEGLEIVPVQDKVSKRIWTVYDRNNNHWLDAMALAVSAAACVGVTFTAPEPIRINIAQPSEQNGIAARDRKSGFGQVLDPWGRPFYVTQR